MISHLNHTLKTVIDENLVFRNKKKYKEKEWIKEQEKNKSKGC